MVSAPETASISSFCKWTHINSELDFWSVAILPGSWVTVRPADFVLSDEDDVLIIPNDVVDIVLVEAERLTEKQRLIRTELQPDLSPAEALAKYEHI